VILDNDENLKTLKDNLKHILHYAQNIDMFDSKNIVNNIKSLTEKETELLNTLITNVKDKSFTSL